MHSGWNCLRALAGGHPMQALYSWNPRLVKRISVVVETSDFDVVHVEHLRGAKYALHANPAEAAPERILPPVVWDSVDCISDLFRHASQNSSSRRMRLAAAD